MPTRRTAHPKQPMSAERRDTSSTPTDPMLVDTTVSSTAARPGSSSMPLRPGDALTVWRGEKCSRATFFASSTTQLQVIWSGGELEGSCEALPRTEIKWLAGWHESANFAQASSTHAFTTSIDHLMHCCTINTAPKLTVIFCTLTHPNGEDTCAAFDLCPQRDCDVGSYIPVGVRLHELSPQTDALLLTVYLPDPLYVRLDQPSEQIAECGDHDVALGLGDGSAELYIRFGHAPLKKAFMECVRSAVRQEKRRRA